MKRTLIIISASLGLCFLISCEKYLDVKPNKKLVVPKTLTDAAALLDYTFVNTFSPIGEAAADEYYLSSADWAALPIVRDRNVYLWQNDAIDADGGAWEGRYHIILVANEVIRLMKNISPDEGEKAEQQRLHGSGYFFRGYAMFNLLELFSKPYNKATAQNDMGIAIRLTPDMNEMTVRSSVQASYDQIISDFEKAADLLPLTSIIQSRPNKSAAYGSLARVYLQMEEYDKAALYADSALQIHRELMDYNTVSLTATAPFARFNKEVIFFASGSAANFSTSRCRIDTMLVRSYHSNDLRRSLFFVQNVDKSYSFKGDYNGQNGSALFMGITTSELYLIKAEALVRTGKVQDGLNNLNLLLINRWKKGTFTPYHTTDANLALHKILEERRKELVLRGSRWNDLRRLNKDVRFAITLKRQINGDTYTLLPNDKRYTFPIPQVVIEQTGIPQN